jgi:FMN phosphatase YigB (HAD superfamily)
MTARAVVFDLFKTLGEFEWIITDEDATHLLRDSGYEKSNPRIYRVITDRLQVEPSETVVIGDDPVLDIHNAKQLGMRPIHIPGEGAPSELTDGVAKDVLEAVEIVEEWD